MYRMSGFIIRGIVLCVMSAAAGCGGDTPDGDACEAFEEVGESCVAGTGSCARFGTMECPEPAGEPVCSAVPGQPEEEICDGVDNDCDGETDEELARERADDLQGVCQGAVKVCAGTEGWLAPDLRQVDDYEPEEQSCDGVDNDCDGETDEGFELGEACTAGMGECEAAGVVVCAADALSTTCGAEPGEPADEVCDGLDNDCDGETDEDLVGTGGDECSGEGVCASGVKAICTDAAWVCMYSDKEGYEEIEVSCDGLDNDCDGDIDEGFDLGAACKAGVGECEAAGVVVCAADALSTTCDAEPGQPTVELCDDLDNDCDGLTDEFGICAGGTCEGMEPGTELCSYGLSESTSAPAMNEQGRIYTTASETAFPKLRSIDPNTCEPVWEHVSQEEGWFHSPAIGVDGTVYVGFTSMYSDIPSKLLAFDGDGVLQWTLPMTDGYVNISELAIGGDGTIYFGDGYSGGGFYAVNAGGTLKWTLDIGGSEFQRALAIGPDGTIYAATWKYFQGPLAAVYAITDSGSVGAIKWQFAPAGGDFSVSHSPAVGEGGTVYIGLFLPGEGRTVLYALSPDTGAELWSSPLEGDTTTSSSSITVGPDDNVYMKSSGGLVYAFLSDGAQKWPPFDTGATGWYGAPALGADGRIYVGSPGGFFSLDADDGTLDWSLEVEGSPGSPTIAQNGVVWVPTSAALYAVCSDCPGLANAPWPKSLCDERNTASVETP